MRWVTSSFRTGPVMQHCFNLFAHFSLVTHDNSLNSKKKTQFKGLASKLSTSAFFIFSVDVCCSRRAIELSESLQAESIHLHKAHRGLITRQVEIFVSRKSEGEHRFFPAYMKL